MTIGLNIQSRGVYFVWEFLYLPQFFLKPSTIKKKFGPSGKIFFNSHHLTLKSYDLFSQFLLKFLQVFDISRGKNTFEVRGWKVRGWKGWKVRCWEDWKVWGWKGKKVRRWKGVKVRGWKGRKVERVEVWKVGRSEVGKVGRSKPKPHGSLYLPQFLPYTFHTKIFCWRPLVANNQQNIQPCSKIW